MKNLTLFLALLLTATCLFAQERFVFTEGESSWLPLVTNGQPVSILADEADHKGVLRAVNDLKDDFRKVTGNSSQQSAVGSRQSVDSNNSGASQLPTANRQLPTETAIIVGTKGKSATIDRLIKEGKIVAGELNGKREKYLIQTVDNPAPGIRKALVIAGSDKRGTIYGIYELSRQIGVSPWYWWADVPVTHRDNLYAKPGSYTDGEPAVTYRGIFINDEAPAFQGWCEEKFGGVNSKMYEHMFELILRLKGNFLWPAMWGNALYHDDPRSGALADEMGVVLGTSHHEPMGRAHEEWRYYNKGVWDYDKNKANLQEFWRGGMERMKDFETVVTVGMRGDGDAPMSEGANIALLQRIITDQRRIIAKVTGKKAEERPQAWALYKEVQEYYDKGMRVPDDVTLLLCDDNWGNIRKLPALNAPKRKGGYGIYYHFDYVGGPRNYKWLNVTQNERTYEQMSLAYRHGVDKIWVVNVGDLKPMEFPISFFLDLAWNPDRFHAQNLAQWTEAWVTQQFGGNYVKEITRMLDLYTKYNSRVTPELLDDKTFSLDNYDEYATVLKDYKDLSLDALRMYNLLPAAYRDAFDELVLFPINAVCNLYEMYYAFALNKKYAAAYDTRANAYADKVKECFARDAVLTQHYNKDIAGGKWAHQMDQQRIGYTSWNNPQVNIMPKVEYVYREEPAEKRFIEADGYVAIEAHHYARAKGDGNIRWEIIPNLGRTGSAVTTFPQAAYPQANSSVYLEYDMQTTFAGGDVEVQVFLAPTLNFNANKGLRYALSFDGGEETVVNFNGHYQGELGDWQGERIIKTTTKMTVGSFQSAVGSQQSAVGSGQSAVGSQQPASALPTANGQLPTENYLHTLRIRVLEPGIVLEKILVDFGGLKPSYLGAPESQYINTNSPFPKFPPQDGLTTRLDHDQMMEQLGITYPALPPSAGAPNKSTYHTVRSAFGLWTNYVSEWEPNGDYYTGAKFYKPLKLHDLTGLTADSWPARRAEIFDEVQKIYGYIPAAAAQLKIEWTVSEPVLVTQTFSRAGMVETVPFRQYTITGKIDSTMYPGVRNVPVLSGTLRVPASVAEGTKVPIVINYAMGFGRRFIMGDEDLWKTMAPAGIGVLYFNAGELQPDNGEGLTSYLIGLVNKGSWRKPTDWGSLVAWSWGISRFIDFFERDNSLVDAKRIAVTGHSRYGKATLVAMAYDTRISTAFPSSSGAMGVAPTRRHWGEDIENSTDNGSYHWLAGNAMRYLGVDESSTDGYLPRKVINMQVDAESLVALCAPRPIFIGGGVSEQGEAWTDPQGQYMTAVAASPVYELLGKQGLVMTDIMDYNGKKIPTPVTDKAYLSGDIGYRRHHGGHEAAPNYPTFKEFILKYWK